MCVCVCVCMCIRGVHAQEIHILHLQRLYPTTNRRDQNIHVCICTYSYIRICVCVCVVFRMCVLCPCTRESHPPPLIPVPYYHPKRSVCVCVYIYISICVCVCVYVCEIQENHTIHLQYQHLTTKQRTTSRPAA